MAEAKKEENAAPKKPLNIKAILTALFAVVNLGATGGGAYLVYASTMAWHAPMLTEDQLKAERERTQAQIDASGAEVGPLIYTLEKFTVNLAGEPRRTIQIEVNLEMLGKDGFEEVINPENKAKARDRIVKILNEKTFSEVESIQGKLFLKDKIATEINGILDQGVVKDVYFSQFVVQ